MAGKNRKAFASEVRTASENSKDLKNIDSVGCHMIIDMTAISSQGTVTLDAGASGSVDGITVDGIQIMSGAEAFDNDLPTTAENVAANITAHTSSPNYNAVAVGAEIQIESESGGDTLVVVSSTTTITSTDVNMAANTVTFTLQGKDDLSDKYYDLLASAAIDSVSTTVLRVHPSFTAASNTVAKDGLPQFYRVQAEHADDSPVTYSVGINLF